MILDKFLNLEGTSIQGYQHLENIGIVFRICPRCGLESDKLKSSTFSQRFTVLSFYMKQPAP